MGAWQTYLELAQWETPQQKRGFLDYCNNTFPYASNSGNLEVTHLTKEIGTKWRPWFEIRDNPWWTEKVNNMLIPLCFIVFDLDAKTEQELTELLNRCIYWLKKNNQKFAIWKTGSKGYHIEIFVPNILHKFDEHGHPAPRSNEEIKRVRKYFIRGLHSDLQKTTPRTMIAIPGAPHWKTGNKKTLLESSK